jgi:hypothetical protein
MYIQRRMKTEGGREITIQIIFFQICKLKSIPGTLPQKKKIYLE